MTTTYRSPRLLRSDDALNAFESRSPEQTEWLPFTHVKLT